MKRTIYRLNYETRADRDIYRSIFQSTSGVELRIIIRRNFNRRSGDDESVKRFKWKRFGAAFSNIHIHTFLKKKHMHEIPLSAVDVYLSIRRVVSSDFPKIKCCVRTACIIIFLYRFESPCQKYSYVISIFNGNIREPISVGSCFSSNELYNLH